MASLIWYVRNIFFKTNISHSLIPPWYVHLRVYVSGGKNVSFKEKFVYVPNEWSFATELFLTEQLFWKPSHNLKERIPCRSTRPDAFCEKGVFNSQENTYCGRVSILIKLQTPGLQLHWKRLRRSCFFVNFPKFSIFYRTTLMAA